MKQFESFTIYPMPRELYEEVKAVLIEKGYNLCDKEWEDGDDCITTTSVGDFMTHQRDSFPRDKTYTVDEFLSKYRSLTPPLTPDEIKQLRELLKSFSPKPKPQPETYEGVFSFDSDGANCNFGKQRLYWMEDDQTWAVVTSTETESHILVESPHEVGEFYLLDPTLGRLNPTNYGLFDGEYFWRWNEMGGITRTHSATNLKVVKA